MLLLFVVLTISRENKGVSAHGHDSDQIGVFLIRRLDLEHGQRLEILEVEVVPAGGLDMSVSVFEGGRLRNVQVDLFALLKVLDAVHVLVNPFESDQTPFIEITRILLDHSHFLGVFVAGFGKISCHLRLGLATEYLHVLFHAVLRLEFFLEFDSRLLNFLSG